MKRDNNYRNIHQWLRNHYGKANKCESHNCKGQCKRYEWAIIHGFEYERNRNNYIQLCSSCHLMYDYTDERKKNMSASLFGKIRIDSKVVIKCDKSGKEIAQYNTLSIAARENKMLISSIMNCLSGRSNTANGYRWKIKQQ